MLSCQNFNGLHMCLRRAQSSGTTGEHSRRKIERDRRDGRERRDTRNLGLRVAPVTLGVPVARLRVLADFFSILLDGIGQML